MLWLDDSIRQPLINLTMMEFNKRTGHLIGQTYVCGFPKSGTTWIAKMVAGYLGLPFLGGTYVAFGFPGVIHNHWDYHPSFDQTIYVIRDGRDVLISVYMSVTKGYLARKQALKELGSKAPMSLISQNIGRFANIEKRFRKLYGSKFDPMNVMENMPRFIEAELKKPFIIETQTPWHKHIQLWRSNAQKTTFVHYEKMLENTKQCLLDALSNHFGAEKVNEKDLDYIVNRYSFENQTGRLPGQEDRKSDIRKGVAGDWQNYFNQEACQVFDYYAGNLLIDLGYEPNRSWHSSTLKS